jgi:methylthioxylose transferase
VLTLRILAGANRARAAAPFLVLAPGAIWAGASADGYFAGVAAWALVLTSVAGTRTVRWQAALAGLGAGVLLGATVYLSYGLVLMVIPVLAVAAATRTARPLIFAAAGFACAAAAFTLAGFDWWQAYRLLRIRYYQGYGGVRPYWYWLWGDLGTVVAAAGLAFATGLRKVLASAPAALRQWRDGAGPRATALVLLPLAFLLAIMAADLSGMSKAETERIWLPFTLWLPATAALSARRDHRCWLAVQAGGALLINHLLLTGW